MSDYSIILAKIESDNLWEKQVTYNRGEYIVVPGTINTDIFYINNGSLRIFVIDNDIESTIRFGYKNNMIVALDSFITKNPTELYIQALKKTTIKAISKSSFQHLTTTYPELQQYWIHSLESIIIQQMARERDLLISSPKERYRRVLTRSPQLFQEIPNKYIAEYLRMTPETLSRLKSEKMK